MKKKTVVFWALFALAIIALQGARPAAHVAATTGTSGIQAPSTTSTNTDTGSTGGNTLGTSYIGTYYSPTLTLGPTLSEYASSPSWGYQGNGNKHTVTTTETLT